MKVVFNVHCLKSEFVDESKLDTFQFDYAKHGYIKPWMIDIDEIVHAEPSSVYKKSVMVTLNNDDEFNLCITWNDFCIIIPHRHSDSLLVPFRN